MNRREFTRNLAAAAALPALPAKALGLPAAAAPVALSQHPYNWAAFIARVHDTASPRMFQRYLRVSDDMSHQICSVLQSQGVITAPNAAGISRAMSPFSRNPSHIGMTKSAFEPTPNQPKPDSPSINQEMSDVMDDQPHTVSEDQADSAAEIDQGEYPVDTADALAPRGPSDIHSADT